MVLSFFLSNKGQETCLLTLRVGAVASSVGAFGDYCHFEGASSPPVDADCGHGISYSSRAQTRSGQLFWAAKTGSRTRAETPLAGSASIRKWAPRWYTPASKAALTRSSIRAAN